MDKKSFEKEVKRGCTFGFKGKEQKECQKTMMCTWNKCQNEMEAIDAAKLTDEDRKSCENKDWKKTIACHERITKKRGLLDKEAAKQHCEANKCPEILKLSEKRTKIFMANLKNKMVK